jgi:3-phenylpropionate/trans-cinnamate dioxygenase ferredoxin reductase subunit
VATQRQTIAVVGAGLAGLRACEGLRAKGFDGRLVLCGDEAHTPYDRPPLSKQYLAGDWSLDKVWLRPPDRLGELDLEQRLGADGRASALDVAGQVLRFATGEQLAYDGLVIATGSRARLLAGVSELEGAHVLRTLDDARALAEVLRPGARLLLAGAGFIGLEVAATARRLGTEVTVVEPLEVPLGRVLGEQLGRVCEGMHRDEGVGFELGATLEAVDRVPGGLACTTSTGRVIEADALLVGIGAVPATGWLDGSGLDSGPSGLTCDAALVAGPAIVAAGDVARWPLAGEPGTVRIEHRTNAAEQGDHAAASLLAVMAGRAPAPFAPVPYVWSDQYDLKIQVLGLPEPTDEVTVVEGSLAERRFVALFGREGRLSAVVGFGRPRALMNFRTLMERRAPYDEATAFPIS